MNKKLWLGIGAGVILFLAGVGFSQMVMMGKHRPQPRGFRCVQCECVAGDKDCRCDMCKAPKFAYKKHFKMDGEHREMRMNKKMPPRDGKLPHKEVRREAPRPEMMPPHEGPHPARGPQKGQHPAIPPYEGIRPDMPYSEQHPAE